METTVTTSANINDLVEKAKKGNKQAFADLYEFYFDKISQYIYFKVRDSEVAMDLSQQTFLNAWRSIDQYHDIGLSFSAWLYTIAHNLVVDYFRKRKQAIRIYDILETLSQEPTFVDQTLDRDQLDRAIAKLNENEQQVILLRFLEGFTIEEIAKILAKSKGAVSTIQYRALAKLKEIAQEVD